MRAFNSVEEANAYNVGFLQGVRAHGKQVDRPWYVDSAPAVEAWAAGVNEGQAMCVSYFGEEKRRPSRAEPEKVAH